MEKEVFEALKSKLTGVLVECELLQRKINFLNSTYMLEFYEYLKQNLYLNSENDILLKSIQMKIDGKSLEEIKNFLQQEKEQFSVKLRLFDDKYQKALALQKRCKNYQAEDMVKLDEEYKNYCVLYHPVLKVNPNTQEQLVYSALSRLYREGDMMGYRNLFNEIYPSLAVTRFSEEDYDSVAEIFQKNIEELTNTIQIQKGQMPLNKEDIFTDDAKMTNEYADIRQTNYMARDMNRNLQKDFNEHFGYVFELEN